METKERSYVISIVLLIISIVISAVLYFVFHLVFIFLIFIPPVINYFLKRRERNGG